MTKKILTAALAAIMLVAAPAAAKKTSDKASSKKAKMERIDRKFDSSRKAECRQLSDSCKPRTPCAGNSCEFEGLDLTDQQKTQLRALKQKQFQQMKERKDSAKAMKAEAKEKIRAERKAMKEKREAERRAYLKEVKQILGNDKYVLFLENQYIQEGERQQPTKNMRPGGGERQYRHDVPRNHKGKKSAYMHRDKKMKAAV